MVFMRCDVSLILLRSVSRFRSFQFTNFFFLCGILLHISFILFRLVFLCCFALFVRAAFSVSYFCCSQSRYNAQFRFHFTFSFSWIFQQKIRTLWLMSLWIFAFLYSLDARRWAFKINRSEDEKIVLFSILFGLFFILYFSSFVCSFVVRLAVSIHDERKRKFISVPVAVNQRIIYHQNYWQFSLEYFQTLLNFMGKIYKIIFFFLFLFA